MRWDKPFKKCHLESSLNQRDEDAREFFYQTSARGPEINKKQPGCLTTHHGSGSWDTGERPLWYGGTHSARLRVCEWRWQTAKVVFGVASLLSQVHSHSRVVPSPFALARWIKHDFFTPRHRPRASATRGQCLRYMKPQTGFVGAADDAEMRSEFFVSPLEWALPRATRPCLGHRNVFGAFCQQLSRWSPRTRIHVHAAPFEPSLVSSASSLLTGTTVELGIDATENPRSTFFFEPLRTSRSMYFINWYN